MCAHDFSAKRPWIIVFCSWLWRHISSFICSFCVDDFVLLCCCDVVLNVVHVWTVVLQGLEGWRQNYTTQISLQKRHDAKTQQCWCMASSTKAMIIKAMRWCTATEYDVVKWRMSLSAAENIQTTCDYIRLHLRYTISYLKGFEQNNERIYLSCKSDIFNAPTYHVTF